MTAQCTHLQREKRMTAAVLLHQGYSLHGIGRTLWGNTASISHPCRRRAYLYRLTQGCKKGSSAHQKVAELPDLQALQAKQQAVAQATATIAGAVQTFSQNQAKEAQKAQEAAKTEFEQTLKNSNPEGYAAYQKLDDSSKQAVLLADSKYAEAYNAARDWGLGGSNSRLLNAATTLVTGVLGGQTNLQVVAPDLPITH